MHTYANTLVALISSHLPGAHDRKTVERRVATLPTLRAEQHAAVREAVAVLKAGVQ